MHKEHKRNLSITWEFPDGPVVKELALMEVLLFWLLLQGELDPWPRELLPATGAAPPHPKNQLYFNKVDFICLLFTFIYIFFGCTRGRQKFPGHG